jgi:hypothetical protein
VKPCLTTIRGGSPDTFNVFRTADYYGASSRFPRIPVVARVPIMRGMPPATEGARMKFSLISLAVAAAICAGAFGAGQALATTTHHSATAQTLKIVMHDPGCHWFLVHGKFAKTDTVKANRVRLVNVDEAALKVASRSGMQHIAVGKSIVVGRGSYVIMMVGQAPDDNYLKLTVR